MPTLRGTFLNLTHFCTNQSICNKIGCAEHFMSVYVARNIFTLNAFLHESGNSEQKMLRGAFSLKIVMRNICYYFVARKICSIKCVPLEKGYRTEFRFRNVQFKSRRRNRFPLVPYCRDLLASEHVIRAPDRSVGRPGERFPRSPSESISRQSRRRYAIPASVRARRHLVNA